jgi:hypothetical protein
MRRRRWWAAAAAAAAVLAGTALAIALTTGGSGVTTVAAAMRAAGCTYRDVVPLPPKNLTSADYHEDFPTLSTPGRWATWPPSGGGHYRLWAVWSFYRTPVNPRLVVHNEEHGGVVVWWGPKTSKATVDRLYRFYLEQPTGVLGTPIAGLGSRVALTAWTADPAYKGAAAFAYRNGNYSIGRVAVCTGFAEKAFRAFRDAYRGHSPQAFPLEGDRRGCGPDHPC